MHKQFFKNWKQWLDFLSNHRVQSYILVFDEFPFFYIHCFFFLEALQICFQEKTLDNVRYLLREDMPRRKWASHEAKLTLFRLEFQ